MLIALAGWAVWLATLAVWVFLPILSSEPLQIAPEERALAAKFGDDCAATRAASGVVVARYFSITPVSVADVRRRTGRERVYRMAEHGRRSGRLGSRRCADHDDLKHSPLGGAGSTTLNPTGLVHDCYLRMAKAGADGVVDRAHFGTGSACDAFDAQPCARPRGKRGGGAHHTELTTQDEAVVSEARELPTRFGPDPAGAGKRAMGARGRVQICWLERAETADAPASAAQFAAPVVRCT
jgi:hypothetical protein